jgi:ketosteroid isomerase-like protein
MSDTLKNLTDATFRAIEAKDPEAALAGMTDDIVLFDPHYPQPLMTGKAEVAYGLAWAFTDVKSFRFDVDRYFFSEDGTGVAVEVSCHHVLRVGGTMEFTQAFMGVFRDGLLATWTAYEPYAPGGMTGFGLGVGHFFYRLGNRRPR